MLFLFCIAETLHFCFGKSLTTYLGDCLNKTQLQFVWVTFIGSLTAACVNPRGFGIYAYVYSLAGNTIGEKYIQEWQRPTWSDGSNSVFFCSGIAIVLMLVLIAERYRSKKKEEGNLEISLKSTFGALGLRPGELLVTAAFFVMGLRNIRSIIWFALPFIIIGSALLCRIFIPKAQNQSAPIPLSMQKMNVLMAAIVGFLVIPFLPQLKPLLPWPNSYVERFVPTSIMHSSREFKNVPPLMLAQNTPIGAAAFLRKNPPKKLLWNDMVFGSYLVWELDSSHGPWADPRIEMRKDAFWETYLDTCHGKNNPEVALAQRGFSDVLIDKQAKSENNLKKKLKASSNWKVTYEDKVSILFVHAS
jgi:hypothetical protein